MAMTRLTFDTREGRRFYHEPDGEDFEDLEEAEVMAVMTAVAIAKDRVPRSLDREFTVEIRDEESQRVVAVTVAIYSEHSEREPARQSA